MEVKVAVSQKPPALLNLAASLARAVETVAEAASSGARLIVFPEAYLPGYPEWAWRLRPGKDMALANDIHARLLANAVDIAGGGLDPLIEAARKHRVVIVMGLTEVDSAFSRSTLFNTVAVIDADGTVRNRHRKLMPTNPERMVWGMGDASGLRVVDTAVGRIGALICWENYMPLARFTLIAQGIDIYVAPTWDEGEPWISTMRHIAREAGAWVLSGATAIKASDIPAAFPGRDTLFTDDEWINSGDAVIVSPKGVVVAGPLHREAGILYATIDPAAARNARKSLDVGGHYGRPDIFRLEVDTRNRAPVSFVESEGPSRTDD